MWRHLHDDVIKWKHFPRYWPFVRGIPRSPVNSPHKGQWRGALMFSLICARINDWVNNREAGDLRRYRTHYDVIVMSSLFRLESIVVANSCGGFKTISMDAKSGLRLAELFLLDLINGDLTLVKVTGSYWTRGDTLNKDAASFLHHIPPHLYFAIIYNDCYHTCHVNPGKHIYLPCTCSIAHTICGPCPWYLFLAQRIPIYWPKTCVHIHASISCLIIDLYDNLSIMLCCWEAYVMESFETYRSYLLLWTPITLPNFIRMWLLFFKLFIFFQTQVSFNLLFVQYITVTS